MPDRNKPSQGCIKDFHIVDSRIPDIIEVVAEVFKLKNINAFEATKVNIYLMRHSNSNAIEHPVPIEIIVFCIHTVQQNRFPLFHFKECFKRFYMATRKQSLPYSLTFTALHAPNNGHFSIVCFLEIYQLECFHNML